MQMYIWRFDFKYNIYFFYMIFGFVAQRCKMEIINDLKDRWYKKWSDLFGVEKGGQAEASFL